MTDMETVVNDHYVRVKKWCASCQHREVQNDGTRICSKVGLIVEQKFKCSQWEMSDGLKIAGLQTGAVVRLKGTQIVLIH